MKKTLKILFITAGVFVIITAAAAATVPLWFPLEKVKDIVTEQAGKITGRRIAVGELKFNIFKGIELHNVAIGENPQYGHDRAFIKDELVVLKYNLFALFAKKLVIHDFSLVEPRILIIKEKDGKFNFSDIIENLQKTGKKEKKQPGKEQKKRKNKETALDLIITSISVKNGEVRYVDRSKKNVQDVKMEKFNFKMEDVVLSAVKPIGAKADCIINYKKHTIPVSLKTGISADLRKKQAEINIKPLMIGETETTGIVEIKDLKNITGNFITKINSNDIVKLMDEESRKKTDAVSHDINITNTAVVNVKGGKLEFRNNTNILSGGITYNGKKAVEQIRGSISLRDDFDLNAEIEMLLSGSSVKITVDGEKINIPEKSRVDIDVYSPKIAAETLFVLFPSKTKEEKKALKTEKTGPEQRKDLKRKTTIPDIYMTLKADSIFFKTVQLGKTFSNTRIAGNEVYSETSIDGYEGTITANLNADMSAEKYGMSFNVYDVAANKFINDLIEFLPDKNPEEKTVLEDLQGNVHGKLNMRTKFAGETFNDIPRTIKGEGKVTLADGRIKMTDLGKELSRKFGMKFMEQAVPFTDSGLDFKMSGGRADLVNIRVLNGPEGNDGDIRIRGRGYVTVDNKMDISLENDLNPKTGRDIENAFAKAFGVTDISYGYNPDGWMPLDVRIYGEIKKKKFDFSQKRMMKNISENLADKAGNFIKNLLQKQ
ncbi:MAG: AsmA family protein [bacterium]